jgi:hypothetical protein
MDDDPMDDDGSERSSPGGRPRKDPADRRTETYGLRLSPKEKAELEDRAERAGLSLAEYLRRRALGKPVKTQVDKEATHELNRIGVNLNQIAHVANAGDLEHIQGQAAEAIEEVRALIEELGQQ